MTRYGKSIILMLIHVDKSTFPFMQDPGHFPHNRTNTNCHCAPLTVCSEHEQTEKKKRETKAKTASVKKQKKRRMVSPLPSSSGSFLSCMYTACTQLSVTQVLLFSLSLSLSPTRSLSTLALPFRLKPEGKSLLLNSDAALNEEIGSSQ